MVEILEADTLSSIWFKLLLSLPMPTQKYFFTNRYTERLFGYSREEIEGERIRDAFPAKEVSTISSPTSSTLRFIKMVLKGKPF